MIIELDMTEAKFFTTLIFHNNSQQGISIVIKDAVSIENHLECHCYAHTNCYLAIPLLKFRGSNLGKVESKHWIFCWRENKMEKILGRIVTWQISANYWCYSQRL